MAALTALATHILPVLKVSRVASLRFFSPSDAALSNSNKWGKYSHLPGAKEPCYCRHDYPQQVRNVRHTQKNSAVSTSGNLSESTEASANYEGSSQQSYNLSLACPICYVPFDQNGLSGQLSETLSKSELQCQRCQRSFRTAGGVADLTISGADDAFQERQLPGTSIFQNPGVAYVYERGWRQGFAVFGFPGVEEEFRVAQEYLAPARGGLLLDVSCGSGLFSRRFAGSQDYAHVVASDYSSSMLQQCREFLAKDSTLDMRRISLVRADVGRLPFATGSVAGVHAGAAIHCWDKPGSAVAEISRVLRPGGVFVASTFLLPSIPIGDFLLDPVRKAMVDGPLDPYRYWTEDELRNLTGSCGLVNFTRIRERGFILFSVTKPMGIN